MHLWEGLAQSGRENQGLSMVTVGGTDAVHAVMLLKVVSGSSISY